MTHPPQSAQHSGLDWASLLLLVVLWGSTFALTKIALESIAPLWIVAMRLCIGAAFLLALLVWRREAMPRGIAIWLWLAAVGGFALLPFFLICWGTQHIDTALAGILFGIGPLVTIALAHFFVPGERMTAPRAIGFAVGFCGLVILVGPDALAGLGGDSLGVLAQFALLGAAAGYALQAICAKLMPPLSPFQKSAGAFLIAAVASIPLAAFTESVPPTEASLRSLIATACMGLFATGLASVVMFRLINAAGPTFLSLTSYLIPLYTLGLGVLVLGETVSVNALAALGLIVAGIAISEWRPRAKI